MCLVKALVFGLLVFKALPANETRLWTSVEGYSFRGTLMKVEPDRVLIKRESDDQEFWVYRTRLSPSDLLVVKGFEELRQEREDSARRMYSSMARNGDFERRLLHWETPNERATVEVVSSNKCPVQPDYFYSGEWMIRFGHRPDLSTGPPFITQLITLPSAGQKVRIEVNLLPIQGSDKSDNSGFFRLSLTDPDLLYYSRDGEPAPKFPFRSKRLSVNGEWKKIVWEVEENFIENRDVKVGIMGDHSHTYYIDYVSVTPLDGG